VPASQAIATAVWYFSSSFASLCMCRLVPQDDSNYFGQSLHLFKITVLNNSTYLEEFTQTMQPSGNGNWYSARTHYIDVQQVGGATLGCASGCLLL
jgi:hypothetical protein